MNDVNVTVTVTHPTQWDEKLLKVSMKSELLSFLLTVVLTQC